MQVFSSNLLWEAVSASWHSTLFDVPNYQYFALNYQYFSGKKQIRWISILVTTWFWMQFGVKGMSIRAPGSCDTCHLTNFSEILPV